MIYILIGESGGGKSTIENYMCSKFKMEKLVSHTTRPIRNGEVDGFDYHFVSKEKFEQLLNEGKLWENVIYNNNLYGLCSENIDYKNKNYVVVVEPNGFRHIKNLVGDYVRSIYVGVDESIRLKRLLERGDSVDNAIKRIFNDRETFRGIESEVDMVVDNNMEVEDAIDEIDIHFGLSFFMYAPKLKPLKIYVAGPYSADTEVGILCNVGNAIDVGIELMKKGHLPYIPHLSHWVDKRMIFKYSWEDWMEFDFKWLKKCDALFYIESSKGADMELELAKKLNKQVYYKIGDVPEIISKEV